MRILGRNIGYLAGIKLAVLGIFLNLAYIGYLLFFPFKTIEFKNKPFPVLNSPVSAGTVVKYKVDYCRYTNVPSQVTRTLVGPTLVTISEDSASTDVGCRSLVSSTVLIPDYVPEGIYHVKLNFCWQVNPLRNICEETGTQDFRVVKPRDK